MITQAQFTRAVEVYPRAVTSPFRGCNHPGAVLRFALRQGGAVAHLARNYIRTGYGACWNALCNLLPADGWIVWHVGDGLEETVLPGDLAALE